MTLRVTMYPFACVNIMRGWKKHLRVFSELKLLVRINRFRISLSVRSSVKSFSSIGSISIRRVLRDFPILSVYTRRHVFGMPTFRIQGR